MGKNTTLRSKLKAGEVALCLLARDIIEGLDLPLGISDEEICRALSVTVPEGRAQQTRLRAALERDEALERNEAIERLRLEGEVLRYRLEHPDCWWDGEGRTYSDDLRAFILALAERVGIGERKSREDFAETCKIPLAVLTAWLAGEVAAPRRSSEAAGLAATSRRP